MPASPDERRAAATRAVGPELYVRRGASALAFYEEAFGATVLHRVGGADDADPVVAQVAVGDASFWVVDESPEMGLVSPETAGVTTVRLLLVVAEPDAVVARAVALGATLVAEPEDAHGWRLGRVTDPYGHQWEVGRPLGHWPPDRLAP